MKYILGIDIGGTKIAIVLANAKGKILKKNVLKTKVGKQAKKSVEEMILSMRQLLSQNKIGKELLGVGVGVPGAIDNEKGVVSRSPNLPGWKGIPIKAILEKEFKRPVYLDNDANVACLGQKVFGAGKGLSDFLYVTISTGIGSGIVTNGDIVHGSNGYAGEIGHHILIPEGNLCPCGSKGCFEAYASGTAVGKLAQKYLSKLSAEKRKQSPILIAAGGKLENVRAFCVYEAARKKDALALSIYREMGYYLGIGLSTIIMILNPQAILLGGGATSGYPYFGPTMRKTLKENTWLEPVRKCKIIKATLGGNVADLGAVALVIEKSKKQKVKK